jgi:osmoprotectant transport system permease protein
VALGALCGLAAVALPWLTLEPNRVARGSAVAAWDAAGPLGVAVFALLWLAALALAARPPARPALARLSAAAVAVIAAAAPMLQVGLSLWLAAPRAAPPARLSLGPGVYAALLGSYLVLVSLRDSARGRPAALSGWIAAAALAFLALAGRLEPLAVVRELEATGGRFGVECLNHAALTAAAVGLAALAGVPLGIWSYRSRAAARVVLSTVDALQTVPSLALFGLIVVPLAWLSFRYPALRALGVRGIGAAPALLALTLYALLPIVRNTYTGLCVVPRPILEAGRGMGMSRTQLLARVELPLASRLVLTGLRIATVQTVGNATVAALVGAGGFGVFVFQGLGQAATDLVLLGAFPVVLLAAASDRALAALVDVLAPLREARA